MAYSKEQVQAQLDQYATKRHLNNLATLCLELNADFEVNHASRTIAIKDIGTDRSHYFKAIPDEERPYMQSGKQLSLEDIKNMLAATVPVNRALMPAYAYNYLS